MSSFYRLPETLLSVGRPPWFYHYNRSPLAPKCAGVRGEQYEPNILLLKLEYCAFSTTPRLFQLVERCGHSTVYANVTDGWNWYGKEDDPSEAFIPRTLHVNSSSSTRMYKTLV